MGFVGEGGVRREVGYCYYLAAENPLDRETLALNGDAFVGFGKKFHRCLLGKHLTGAGPGTEAQSWRTTLSSALLTRKTPLYSINPNFRKRFIKKLTRERVVPTISARVSWLILGITVSGTPSLPNRPSSSQVRASRRSLEWNTASI